MYVYIYKHTHTNRTAENIEKMQVNAKCKILNKINIKEYSNLLIKTNYFRHFLFKLKHKTNLVFNNREEEIQGGKGITESEI